MLPECTGPHGGLLEAYQDGTVKMKSLSRVRFFATPWTVAYQAPLSMGFSRQEYWSGVPLPSPLLIVSEYEI